MTMQALLNLLVVNIHYQDAGTDFNLKTVNINVMQALCNLQFV